LYSNGRGAGRTMNKTWVMWSLLFISAGGIGLGVIFYEKGLEEKDSARYRSQYSESAEDKYLDLYEQWRQLSPAEQLESPWGFGKYAVSEIREQLKREQSSRLRANIADLATGVKKPHMLADILYGKNWRLQVAKYRKKELAFASREVSQEERTSRRRYGHIDHKYPGGASDCSRLFIAFACPGSGKENKRPETFTTT